MTEPTADPGMDEARAAMRRTWGYEDFRPGQRSIIEAVLDGRDVLGVLPTGGGKSLCYQVPALVKPGFALVISPLIALMQDQVQSLQARGIDATFINSTLPPYDIDQRLTDAEHGRYDLVYVAPERLTTDRFEARAERLDVSLLAVDEAHCISEWGHHFRPDYMKLAEGRELLGRPPTIAVTATATPAVRRDIIDRLELDDPATIVRGFDRPNIRWSVFRNESKGGKLRDVVDGVEGSGIVYAATRRSVERWTSHLENRGVSVAGYHGGMEADRRESAQEQWVRGDTRVIVATNAFGMGIDKPDVRFVVHVDLPSSVESYYQEAGRAGRDGKPAYAVLLFNRPDAETQESLIEASYPTAREVRQVYDAVCNAGQVPIGSEPDGPLAVNLRAVLKITGFSRTKVRTAVSMIEQQGAWTVLPQRRHFGLIRFSRPAGAVREYARSIENGALADFVRTLLRTVHADAFRDWWRIDVRRLERRTEVERERLLRGLRYLQERGILQWRPPGASLQVELAFPRSQRIPVDDSAVQTARRRAEQRLDTMLRYARSATCRRRFLLAYFGQEHPERCGTCDVCMGRHRARTVGSGDEEVLRRILQEVDAGTPREEWFDEAPEPRHRIDALVDWLLANDFLAVEDPLEGLFALTDAARRRLEDDE